MVKFFQLFTFKSLSAKKALKSSRKVKNALNLFAKAHDKILKATQELHEAHKKDQEAIDELVAHQAVAKQHIEANTKVLDKLKEFLPETHS